jgi:hypothetical protein
MEQQSEGSRTPSVGDTSDDTIHKFECNRVCDQEKRKSRIERIFELKSSRLDNHFYSIARINGFERYCPRAPIYSFVSWLVA